MFVFSCEWKWEFGSGGELVKCFNGGVGVEGLLSDIYKLF